MTAFDLIPTTILVLREECDRLQETKRRALAIADKRSKENVRLRAEVERLREALEQILRTPATPFPDPGAHSWYAYAQRVYQAWRDCVNIATAALAGPSK